MFSIDHASHGKSDGRRGVIEDDAALPRDFVTFVNEKRAEYAALPAFVLAHSMGGLIGKTAFWWCRCCLLFVVCCLLFVVCVVRRRGVKDESRVASDWCIRARPETLKYAVDNLAVPSRHS